jgi:putative transposase
VSRRTGYLTTTHGADRRQAPDLVERNFIVEAPRCVLGGRHHLRSNSVLSYLYLAVVLDVWGRRVVGWSMANHLRTELVLEALNIALWQRRPNDVIHHSDQGC